MRPTCRKAWWTGGGGGVGAEAAGRGSLCRGSLSWANLGGVDAAILPGRGRGPGPSPAALLWDRTEQSWSGGSPGPTHSPARRPTWSISGALGGPCSERPPGHGSTPPWGAPRRWAGDRTLVPPHPAPGNPQSLRRVERVWGRCEPGAGRALWAAWLETSAAGQSNQPRGEAPSLAGERRPVGWMQGGGWRSRRGLRPGDTAHVFLYF